MNLGELLHDDLFGLFEAMSAIEMMDPKMDAGMMCNRGIRKTISFDQAVQVKLEWLAKEKIEVSLLYFTGQHFETKWI